MAKKIVFIQGSPRKHGNTRAVTALAMSAARQEGAEVTDIDATSLEYKIPGCLGCGKCQESEEFICTLGDQLAAIVATLPQYDGIVLATPIYWWSYSAQMKIVVDRMYSLGKFREDGTIRSPLAGKTLALIATGAGAYEDNLELLERQWKNPTDMLGCSFLSCLFPNTTAKAGELAQDPAAAEKAAAFGRMLATN